MSKRLLLAAAMAATLAAPAIAWEGYDWARGADVTIEPGNLVRPGLPIEVYDWEAGEYRVVDVLDMHDLGGSVEVEVNNHESGEIRMLEMEE